MAVSIEFGKKLDKEFENLSLEEILDAPPSALAGLTEKHAELLAGMGIKTIRDLGSNRSSQWPASWWRCPTTPASPGLHSA